MDTKKNQPITIAYAGNLKGYQPPENKSFFSFIKEWIWTYSVKNIDSSTRTGYFLFKAIKILKEENEINNSDVHIHLWGNIEKNNQQIVDQLRINEFVTISGYKSKQETIELLKSADILFLPLEQRKKEQKPLFIPGKLFEYLSFGKPILALAEDSDCSEILIQSGLGIITSPNNPEKIALTLKSIINKDIDLDHYTPNISFIKNFSFQEKTKQLANIFNNVSDEN